MSAIGVEVATTTTDRNGGYYFDAASIDERLVAGQSYRVVIESINTDRGRSLSRAGNFVVLGSGSVEFVAGDEAEEVAEDDAAVYRRRHAVG